MKKKKLQSTPELLYSIEIFFVCFFFLKGTVWGVVGHEHQCAFFCVFFEKVLRGGGGGEGISTQTFNRNRRRKENPAPRVQSQCRGGSAV